MTTSAPTPDTPPGGTSTDDVAAFAARIGPGRLIGLDLGSKTIGVALSDVTRLIASAFETIRRTKFTADARRIDDIVGQQQVVGIVLGLPSNLDGTAGPRVQATRAFARNLNRMLATPILFWDERLTTQEAERLLIAADTSRRRRAEVIDQVAATLILQGALDRLRREP